MSAARPLLACMEMASVLTPRQRKLLRFLLGLAVFVLANSAYLFTAGAAAGGKPAMTAFYQVMLLSHLGLGFLLLATATVFVVWHLGRVRRLLRWPAVSSGGGLTLAAYALFASGLFILYESNSREHRWIYYSHQALALLAPALYGVHRFVSHYKPARSAVVRPAFALAALYLAMLGAHFASRPPEPPPFVAEARPADPFVPFDPANYPSPESPFFPSRTTTDSGKFFPARIITRGELGEFDALKGDIDKYGFNVSTAIGAETCQRCHRDIVEQWRPPRTGSRLLTTRSTARRSRSCGRTWTRRRRSGARAATTRRSCSRASIDEGDRSGQPGERRPGSPASPATRSTRSTAATGNGGYHIADEKPSPYLGDRASSGLLRFLADQMTKAKPAAHKALHEEALLRDGGVLLRVPQGVDRRAGEPLALLPRPERVRQLAGQRRRRRTRRAPSTCRPSSKSCHDCHMPLEDAPLGDVSAKSGKVRSHRFLAVNTALPYVRGDTDSIRRIEALPPRREAARRRLRAAQRGDGTESSRALDRREALPRARGAGRLRGRRPATRGSATPSPAARTTRNEGWVDFTVTDESGRELFRSGAIGADGPSRSARAQLQGHDGPPRRHRGVAAQPAELPRRRVRPRDRPGHGRRRALRVHRSRGR